MKSRIYKRKFFSLAKKMPRVLSAFLILFALATVFLAIESSTQGAELVRLENEENILEAQNQELRSSLVSSTSLAKIADEAQKMGMVKPEKLSYIKGEKPVAKIP